MKSWFPIANLAAVFRNKKSVVVPSISSGVFRERTSFPDFLSPISCSCPLCHILLRHHRNPACFLPHAQGDSMIIEFWDRDFVLGTKQQSTIRFLQIKKSTQPQRYQTTLQRPQYGSPKTFKWNPETPQLPLQRHPQSCHNSPMNIKVAQKATNPQGERTMHEGSQQHHILLQTKPQKIKTMYTFVHWHFRVFFVVDTPATHGSCAVLIR